MNFKLIQTDPASSARAGSFSTDHGIIQTPIFMPVGTAIIIVAAKKYAFVSVPRPTAVSYTHLTLPTKRIV